MRDCPQPQTGVLLSLQILVQETSERTLKVDNLRRMTAGLANLLTQ